MATTTNYGWDTPDDTDLVKDGAAAIRTLGSSVDTTTKNLNPQTTTGALAYRSATANVNTALPIGTAGQILAVSGGVPAWINNDQGDITEVQAGVGISVASGTGPIPVITNSSTDLITTAGDLLYGTAADTVARLGIGTANQVLAVNSGATAPQWVTASSSALVKLASGTISGTSISFDNVFTNTYDNYYLFWNITDTDGAQQMRLRVGGTDNTGSDYAYVNMAVGFSGTPAWTALSNGTGQDHWLNLPVGSAGNRYSWQCVFTGRDASSLKDVINYQGWFNRRASSSGIISGAFAAGTDFDGFTVYNTGSTFSGTYALYGYSK